MFLWTTIWPHFTGHFTFRFYVNLFYPKIRPAAITGLCGKSELSVWSKIYRILRGKSVRMVYLRMSRWQKNSNEWVHRTGEISDTNRRERYYDYYIHTDIYFLFKNNLLLNMFNLKVQKSTMKDANHTNCPPDRYNDTTKSKRKIWKYLPILRTTLECHNLSVFTQNIANWLRKHVLLIRRYGVFFSFVVLVSKKFLEKFQISFCLFSSMLSTSFSTEVWLVKNHCSLISRK